MNFIPYNGKQPYIYISFSPLDKEMALTVARFLQDAGHKVWLDINRLTPKEVAAKLKNAECVVLIATSNINNSNSVKGDINFALDKEKKLYVVIEDGAKLDTGITIQIGLCRKFKMDELDELDIAIGTITKKGLSVGEKLKRKKRLIIRTSAAIAVVILVTAAGLFSYDFLNPQVPAVTVMAGSKAISELQAAGFEVKEIYEFSDTVPENEVISQSVTSGRLGRGNRIELVISLGKEYIKMDANLQSALIALGLDANNDGKIQKEELAEVTTLDLKGKNIEIIAGLEYAIKLQTLDISDNQIEDISPLKGLKALQKLAADNNQISDISSLAGTTALKTLSVKNNQITNIQSISFFKALKEIYLSGNNIDDKSKLKGFVSDIN